MNMGVSKLPRAPAASSRLKVLAVGSTSLVSERPPWSQGVAFLSLYTLATMHSSALLNLKFSTRIYFFNQSSLAREAEGQREGSAFMA